jgi:hypothetical protein
MATTTAQVKPLEAVGSGRGGGPPAGLVPVTFESQGETIVGRLFPPAFGGPSGARSGDPRPGDLPEGTGADSVRRSPLAARLCGAELRPRHRGESGGDPRCYEDPIANVPSPKRRLPVPITTGKIQMWNSSMRSCSSSVWIRPGLP